MAILEIVKIMKNVKFHKLTQSAQRNAKNTSQLLSINSKVAEENIKAKSISPQRRKVRKEKLKG